MRKGYGQFCPVAKACELLCERWTLVVIRELVAGSQRFNDLRRGLPLMSPTLLSTRLRQLCNAGVIEHPPGDTKTYQLTAAGEELGPLIETLGIWGHRWVGSQITEADLDVGLLMWDIRRGVDATQFPDYRIVIQFEFVDAPDNMAQWWLVSQNREIELCRKDPGYEINLMLKSSVFSLTAVWMRRQSLMSAQSEGDIQVLGDRHLQKNLPKWLQGSPLARMGEQSLRAVPIA